MWSTTLALELSPMSHPRTYTSDAIDVQYDLKRCIHAAECVHGAPQTFDPNRKPWVDPSQDDAGTIAQVVMRCPTGALLFMRKDGGAEEANDVANTVSIQPDGPLYVRGNVEFTGSDGEVVSRETRVALCRCGLSENKPFCDNRHQEGFSDVAALGIHTAAEPLGESNTLQVVLAENGPLLLRGPVTITAVDGATSTTEKCALCRCGQSSNKPFCDGTHKEVGFVAAG